MKKIVVFLMVGIVCFISCGSTGSSNSNSGVKLTSFADVIGKEWKLVEVYAQTDPFHKKVIYDREHLRKEKIEKTYTMTLAASSISGTAAPNTYSAQYKRGQGQAVEIQEIRSTKMAPIVQPEKLQEFTYFGYLQNVYEWNIKNNKLELSSKTDADHQVRLVFEL